jgi:hypothetical protein
MEASLNSLPVIAGSLVLPRIGVWIAEIELATDEASDVEAGKVASLSLGGTTLTGTIYRGGVNGGKARALVLGGGSRLGRGLSSKFYDQPTIKILMLDICNETSEALDGSSDAGTLAFQVPRWHRGKESAGTCIARVVEQAGASWRVLSTGAIWVGPEGWPAYAGATLLQSEDHSRASAELIADTPDVRPGQLFEGRKVGRVRYQFSADQTSTTAWFEEV